MHRVAWVRPIISALPLGAYSQEASSPTQTQLLDATVRRYANLVPSKFAEAYGWHDGIKPEYLTHDISLEGIR